MPIREFKQIRPVDFMGAIEGTKAAASTFGRAFDNFRGAAEDVTARRNVGIDQETESNTNQIQMGLEKLNSIQDFNQADQEGAFDLETLSQKFGNRFDQGTTAKLIASTRDKLVGENTQSTIQQLQQQGGITSNDDIMKVMGRLDPNSVNVDEVASSLKSNLAGTRADKAATRADVVTGREDKVYNDKQSLNEALTIAGKGFSTDANPAQVMEEAGKHLEGANKIAFLKQAKELKEDMSAMDFDQKAEYQLKGAKGQAAIQSLATEADNTIRAQEAAVAQMNPISAETAAQFSDVSKPGSSVLDWFGNKIGKSDWDIDHVSDKYQELIEAEGISNSEAAGLMVEAYRTVEDDYTNMVTGKGIDKDGKWDSEIKRRVNLLKAKKKAEAKLAATQIKYQNRITELTDKNLTDLHEFRKRLRKQNKTGNKFTAKAKTAPVSKKAQTTAEARSQASRALNKKYKNQ